MLKLRHIFPSNHSRAEVEGDRAFFLRNQTGDMFSLYTTPQTRYEGWHIWRNKGFIKLVERIQPISHAGALPVHAITNIGHTAFWELSNGTRIAWKLLPNQSGLTVSSSDPVGLRILLDTRKIYSFPEFGRYYEVQQHNGYLITYTGPDLEQPVYLHIRCSDHLYLKNEWQLQSYPRDAARHSTPTELYTYQFGEVTTDTLGIGFGDSPQEAEQNSLAASKQRPQIPVVGINYTHDTLLNEVNAAKATVQQSLRWLESENGIWAGLPWFHQVWTRDELVTALGVNHLQQREIIERYLGMELHEGELPTFKDSGSYCADGVGWLCLLVREYGLENLSEDTQERLLHFLEVARAGLQKHRQAGHGFIYSGKNATWMDTIGREGYRLEIQCMYALLLEHLYTLTEHESYHQERIYFLSKIQQEFWSQGYLKDGLGDTTLRPNVFVAYLLQPDLLSATAWQGCFEQALKALTTPWGGLSSIDRHNPEFHPYTTGEDNRSYHNGDSWFFMNNLAAIAMLRLNQPHFGKNIVEILQSSTQEILWENMIGEPGEISSATTLESFGCGAQAWSGGTYLALLKEFEDYTASTERRSLSSFWENPK